MCFLTLIRFVFNLGFFKFGSSRNVGEEVLRDANIKVLHVSRKTREWTTSFPGSFFPRLQERERRAVERIVSKNGFSYFFVQKSC